VALLPAITDGYQKARVFPGFCFLGSRMVLIELLLPLYDNSGHPIDRVHHRAVAAELTERFGGLTAHTRAPAAGLWKPSGTENTTRDDIVIYEVMAEQVDARWWKAYRSQLETRFQQEHVVIRAITVDLL
jgi:hypothetical protein